MAKIKIPAWKCSTCETPSLKWNGICRNCGGIATIVEVAKNTTSQKTVRRRWKTVERDSARTMKDADGDDPLFRNIASSTGKVGHLTGLRFDAISRTYVTEVKNRPLPKWIVDAWIQILQISVDRKKNALLHIKPPNLPARFLINGEKIKTGTMAVITQEHHLDLVKAARILNELEVTIASDVKYKDLAELLWMLNNK